MSDRIKTNEAVDVIQCDRLRVIVLQIDAGVDDDVIESTINDMARTLDGARYAVHAVPVESGTAYTSRVTIELEEVE